MKFNHKININIFEFFINGNFDCIQLGQSQEWITHHFPKPKQISTNQRIWQYDDLELYFKNKQLTAIYCDKLSHQKPLYFGKNIFINRHFLTDKHYDLISVIEILNQNQINFQKIQKFGLVYLILQSHVQLIFNPVDDVFNHTNHCNQNQFILTSFLLGDLN